ncbi:MAG TPA: hypothetical protein VEK11_10005 [Thermoanaerobaculia bacterium]|jgi:hypothetical protein|nr:hypothetical protein [Thermoanaerobaculia bacterium]
MKKILVIGDEPLAESLRTTFDVRVVPSSADRATIRAAVKGCQGVFAAPCAEEQARNVIHVVAGAEVDHLVFGSDPLLDEYARSLGVTPTFVPSPDAGTVKRIFDE